MEEDGRDGGGGSREVRMPVRRKFYLRRGISGSQKIFSCIQALLVCAKTSEIPFKIRSYTVKSS